MGRNNIRLLPFSFCFRWFSPAHIGARSPQIGYSSSTSKSTSFGDGGGAIESSREYGEKKRVVGRRIMVVVDPSREAKAALQWALSHSVQNQDTILLLTVIKPAVDPSYSKIIGDETAEDRNPKSWELLHALKRFCQARKPEVEVELCLVEGKERGPTIVEEAKRHGVSLLVLGHKKRSMMWQLLMMWASHHRRRLSTGNGGGVVDYCIQNGSCMILGVRRKGRRGGGYLITSRSHKDFWLLA